MNYAIFTYSADADCLEICVDQIRSVDDNAKIYIFDDGKCPLTPDQIPDLCVYKKTWFNRRGNLNGLECVRGMLACLFDIPGDEPVVKIDADTLLMTTKEIQRSLCDRKKLAGGVQCSVPLAWAGCCYWLTRQAIEKALELFARREFPETKDLYQEDLTITRAMMFLFGQDIDILEWKNGKHLIGVKTADPDELKQVGVMGRNGVTAIHCGQMDFYEPIKKHFGCTIRQACAKVMAVVKN